MTTDRILIGDTELRHQELTEAQRRFLRAEWLLSEMDAESVRRAVDDQKLQPGTVEFVQGVAELVTRIQRGELEPEDLLQLKLERLEDAFLWSRQHVELTREEKERVAAWCRQDGHEELAADIEANLDEED